MIRLRVLRWKDDPGLSESVHCNHKGPYRRRKAEIEEDMTKETETGVRDVGS